MAFIPDEPYQGESFIPDEPEIEPRGWLPEIGAAIGRGAMRVGKGFVGLHETLTKVPYVGAWSEEHRKEELTEAAGWRENIQSAIEKMPRTREGAAGWAVNVVGEAIPYMGAALAGGYTVGLPGAAMVGFSVEGQEAYEDAVRGGATEGEAQLERVIVGSINAAIEALQIGRLMKFHQTGKHSLKGFVNSVKNKAYREAVRAGGRFGSDVLKLSIEEGLEEFAQEGVAIATPAIFRRDYPRKPDGSPDLWAIGERLGAATLGGAVAGGILGGAGAAISPMVELAAPSPARIEATARTIQESKLSDIEKARHLMELEKTQTFQADIPESTRRRLEIAKRFESELIELEAKRPELRKETKEARRKKFGQIEQVRRNVEIDDPIAASRIGRKAMQGYARSVLPEFTEKFSRDDINELAQAVRESNVPPGEYLTLSRFFEELLAEVQPHRSSIKAFDRFFGTNIIEKGYRKRPVSKGQKILQIAAEPFNMLKAMVCSCDFSAGGIQALMVAPNHPVIWGKGVGKGYRAFFSPKYTNLADFEMRTDPRFGLITKYAPKLITQIGGGVKGEEYFVSELAHRIPGIGKMVRASDRAFVTTLNFDRSNLFYQWCEQHNICDENIPDNVSEAEIREILDHIGNLTGRARGKLGGRFERYAPEAGAIFWAPRLYLATAKSMTDWATKSHIRKIAAADLLQAFGTGMMILAFASMIPGNEVEWDPRSSDFAKIKRGNTRISFFGQHTQMMRFVAQLAMRQKKATATGRVYDKPMLDTVLRFMRTKLSPAAAVPVEIATGETFLGKKLRPTEPAFMTEYIANKVVPIFIQDVVDAIRYQGTGTALWMSPLAVHGIGAQTYEIHAGGEAMRLKNNYAHQIFGSDWDEIGPEAQKALREARPLIEVYEYRAKQERENYSFRALQEEEQQELARKILKKLPANVSNEISRLMINFPGLSRRIGSGWYLNKDRYEQYQKDILFALKTVIPDLITSPEYRALSSSVQKEMLQELVDQCRKYVRQKTISEANLKDIEKL